MTVADDVWVPLADVARAHGLRGEVRLRPYNRDSDLLLEVDEVLVRFPDGDEQEVSVDGARRATDAILMKLCSVDDRDRADSLRGARVCVRRKDFPPLEAGEFYACDVEGARVLVASSVLAAGEGQGEAEGEAPRELGKVVSLRTYPTADVLVVEPGDGGRRWEVPLVDGIVGKVDLDAGVILLEGLEGVERE